MSILSDRMSACAVASCLLSGSMASLSLAASPSSSFTRPSARTFSCSHGHNRGRTTTDQSLAGTVLAPTHKAASSWHASRSYLSQECVGLPHEAELLHLGKQGVVLGLRQRRAGASTARLCGTGLSLLLQLRTRLWPHVTASTDTQRGRHVCFSQWRSGVVVTTSCSCQLLGRR